MVSLEEFYSQGTLPSFFEEETGGLEFKPSDHYPLLSGINVFCKNGVVTYLPDSVNLEASKELKGTEKKAWDTIMAHKWPEDIKTRFKHFDAVYKAKFDVQQAGLQYLYYTKEDQETEKHKKEKHEKKRHEKEIEEKLTVYKENKQRVTDFINAEPPAIPPTETTLPSKLIELKERLFWFNNILNLLENVISDPQFENDDEEKEELKKFLNKPMWDQLNKSKVTETLLKEKGWQNVSIGGNMKDLSEKYNKIKGFFDKS